MKFLALCLIILVAGTTATNLFEKYPLNFSSKRSMMTLLTQVETQLKNGGPLDAITHMLNEFVETITEEQVQHDRLWAEQQAECANEFTFREAEVNAAVAALNEAQSTLQGCVTQRLRARQDLEVTNSQLSESRTTLAAITNQRQREAYSFETKSTVWEMTRDAIRVALQILQEIWEGDSNTEAFVQLNSNMNTILKHSIKLGKMHNIHQILSSMAQLANQDIQADESLFEEIRDRFAQYRDNKAAEFQEAYDAEQAAIEVFQQDRARLQSVIEHLVDQKANLEDEIRNLDHCVVTQTGIVNSATAKRDRNQRLWDDAVALCASVEAEYTSATEQRHEELDLLDQIRTRVEARFGEISEDVTERGMQDEFTYENNYEHEVPEFVPTL